MHAFMRTTVNIDAELLARAKVVAARSHRTIGSVLEDALRTLLAESEQPNSRPAVLPDFHYGGGLRPGVDLYDKELMADLDPAANAVL